MRKLYKEQSTQNKLTSNPNFEFIGKCNYYLNEINYFITIFNGVHKIQGRDTNWPTVYPILVANSKKLTKKNVPNKNGRLTWLTYYVTS